MGLRESAGWPGIGQGCHKRWTGLPWLVSTSHCDLYLPPLRWQDDHLFTCLPFFHTFLSNRGAGNIRDVLHQGKDWWLARPFLLLMKCWLEQCSKDTWINGQSLKTGRFYMKTDLQTLWKIWSHDNSEQNSIRQQSVGAKWQPLRCGAHTLLFATVPSILCCLLDPAYFIFIHHVCYHLSSWVCGPSHMLFVFYV